MNMQMKNSSSATPVDKNSSLKVSCGTTELNIGHNLPSIACTLDAANPLKGTLN